MSQKNKPSIFITGVTSGIGREVFKRCVKEEFLITAVIREESQRKALKEYMNDDVRLLVADLSDRDEVKTLIGEIWADKYDYYLLNAGCGDTGFFHELPASSIDKNIETNLLTNMRIVHTVLPKAIEERSKFIFVSSMAARLPAMKCASYATSKAGLSKFCNSLRREYPSLKLLCVEIGAVDTPMHEKSRNIVESKKSFKSASMIAERLYHAMLKKTGIVTLSLDWWVIRKIAMVADDLLTNLVAKEK